jgi:AraC-like DNA-binding protein
MLAHSGRRPSTETMSGPPAKKDAAALVGHCVSWLVNRVRIETSLIGGNATPTRLQEREQFFSKLPKMTLDFDSVGALICRATPCHCVSSAAHPGVQDERSDEMELILRGVAIGALIATAAGPWRAGKGHSARLAGVLFSVSVLAYTLQSSAESRLAIGPVEPIVHFMALGGSGLFWLFILALFDDREVSPLTLAPFVGLTLLGLFGWLGPRDLQPTVWIIHNLIEVGFAAHALFVIVRSWRGDLVEARRRLRGPFLAAVTLFVVVLAGFEIGESFGIEADWYELLGATALALFCVAGAIVFLQAQPALFGAAAPTEAPAPSLGAGEQHTLARLDEVMGKGEAWKCEGLTIGTLADEVGVPEHRLRPLINDRLGHRNFVAFVNAYRIGAAKERLADPATARTPISAIAFELGFASLGPFNRAFKEATGQTPSEWRKAKLGQGSPISENPR